MNTLCSIISSTSGWFGANLVLLALWHSIWNKDWSYHTTQAVATTNMYSEFLKEYFWVFNLLLWGIKFYTEYRKLKAFNGESDVKRKLKGRKSPSSRRNW